MAPDVLDKPIKKTQKMVMITWVAKQVDQIPSNPAHGVASPPHSSSTLSLSREPLSPQYPPESPIPAHLNSLSPAHLRALIGVTNLLEQCVTYRDLLEVAEKTIKPVLDNLSQLTEDKARAHLLHDPDDPYCPGCDTWIDLRNWAIHQETCLILIQ